MTLSPIITTPSEIERRMSGQMPYSALTLADSLMSPPVFLPNVIPVSFVRHKCSNTFLEAFRCDCLAFSLNLAS